MAFKTSTLIWVFIWSIFMGITVGSIGIGAAFPAANLITAPFVCPNGKLQLSTQDYNPSPVETVTTETWYCVDNSTGSQREVGIFQMAIIAGPIYGFLLFAVIFAFMWYRARHPSGPQAWSSQAGWQASSSSSAAESSHESGSAEQRLARLKHLLDTGLITEQDYNQKKARILNEL